MSRKRFVILFIVLLLLFVILLIPYFYLSFFSYPIGDDLFFSSLTINRGYCATCKMISNNMTGRYFSNLLLPLNPMVWGSFTAYKLVPFVSFFMLIISAYFFLHSILRKYFSCKTILIAVLFFCTVYFFQAPALFQNFYWFTGIASYQIGNILVLPYFALIIDLLNKRFVVNRPVHVFILIIMLFALIGVNEVLMLILVAFHVLLYISFYKNTREKHFIIVLLILSVAFSCIVFFSNGTSERLAYYHHNKDLIHSSSMTLFQTVRFLFSWIFNIPMILFSIIFIPFSIKLNKRISAFRNLYILKPFVFIWFIPLVLFLCIFPPYCSTGILGQHRTVNVAYFFFVFLWFSNLIVWSKHIERVNIHLLLKRKRIYYAVLIALFLSLILSNNNEKMVYSDILSGKVKEFDSEMKIRFETLALAKQNKNAKCYLKKLKSKPGSLSFWDVGVNPDGFVNYEYAIYYKIPEVVCEDCLEGISDN